MLSIHCEQFRAFCLYTILLLVSSSAQAQKAAGDTVVAKKKYYTQHIEAQSIKLDGIPDETAWNEVAYGGDFIQHQPNEADAPSFPTRFKILYDDKFLYLAYWCTDPHPDSITRRMGRRDEFPGDWMEVNIDSYHDLRTAFSFTLSASGVRGDEFVSNNGNYWDNNWNPIWYARAHVNDTGWTGEVKIPFSQLRYGNEKDKVWGIQVQRLIFRKQERAIWQFIPQRSGVWVSGFGELHGLKDVKPQKQIEIAPYIVAHTDRYQPEVGNPFATGKDSKISAGVDGKVAVTSDLILDFTVNPDFGQVEADPSQVRIDGYQNFFEERRPFFIESRNIFDYTITGSIAGGEYDSDLLFYSRRIGGSPHAYPSLKKGEYANVPDKTSILGAVKFSGKTRKGWSIGVLESITEREKAEIDVNGARHKEIAEPLTSYFTSRVQKDINAGNTVLGGIFTGVNREGVLTDILHRSAYSGGFDFLHYWKNRTWYYKGNVITSRVEGTTKAIYNTQTSFEHLFQRGNITEAGLDSTRTSLTGTGGTFMLGKNGGHSGKYGQVLKFQTGITWRSPELELNDIGFMYSANEINHFTWVGLNFQQPFSIFRNANINYNHWSRWDFGGQFLYQEFNTNSHVTFKNFWNAGAGLNWNPYEVSNTSLRGAYSLRKPPGGGCFFNVGSDSRKRVSSNLNLSMGWARDNTVGYRDISLTVSSQPLDAFKMSLSGSYTTFWRQQDQFVDEVTYNNLTRTIVAGVNQETVRMTLRLNYNILPDLTIQYYAQPYTTRPLYKNFAYVIDPLNDNYDARFQKYDQANIKYADNEYHIDENADGVEDYSFSSPDFNFVQFRSNLVIRWEYRPGSELYLVWSQGNTPDAGADIGAPIANSLFNNAFNGQAKNIGLIKFTYRFVR